MEDFVICRDSSGSQVLKFHSLSKLEKGEITHLMLQNKGTANGSKVSREKVEELHEKMHAAFFFE